MIKKDKVKDFMKEHLEVYGQTTWQIGEVVKGSKQATLTDDRKFIHVKGSFLSQ